MDDPWIPTGVMCTGDVTHMETQSTLSRPKNVFVLALDDHNRQVLEEMRDADRYRFHGVLTYEEIYRREISFAEVLAKAQNVIDRFDGPVDAIIGFWDFPVSSIVPLLRRRYGLPTAGVEDIVRCEHKFWSRQIQEQVIDEHPRYALVDPFRDTEPPAGLRFPMWIKPVKSFASMLAIKVEDHREFRRALAKIRTGIGRLGEPFEALLDYVEVPVDIAAAGGQVCIAEEALEGLQVTVEGYRHEGEVVIYGIVDSIYYDDHHAFLRYEYPSSLPEAVQARMADISRRVVQEIGLEGMTFNIEYFWNPETDAIDLLEINPRHSQSHADLFADVDGISNHEMLVDLSLGRRPEPPAGRGRYDVAATWFVRRFSDGVVRRHPSPDEVARIEAEISGVSIEINAKSGARLSQMHGQDHYSYRLATVFVGAGNRAELTDKFERVRNALRFDIDDVASLGELTVFDPPAAVAPMPPAIDGAGDVIFLSDS